MPNNPLLTNKKKIIDKWIDLSLEIYPPESQKFFRTKAKEFSNPVGGALSSGLLPLFDWLLSSADTIDEETLKKLEQIVRIRAVQEMSAGEAVSFVFMAKRAARESLRSGGAQSVDFNDFDSRVDALALKTFDLYMNCREKVYELKTNELKRNTSRLMQRFTGSYWTREDMEGPED
jgi:hypothetical protein